MTSEELRKYKFREGMELSCVMWSNEEFINADETTSLVVIEELGSRTPWVLSTHPGGIKNKWNLDHIQGVTLMEGDL